MAASCREKITSEEYGDWIIDFELTEELNQLDQSGVDYCYEKIDEELGIIYAKRSQMEEVGLLNYPYQQLPSLFDFPLLITDSVMEPFDPSPLIRSGISRVQGEPLNLTGKGVVLAFIGTGIDYRNPLFQNPDGSTRILSIWDQTIEESREGEDSPVPFGTIYTREQINEALKKGDPYSLVPTKDERGITTAMASVAAGSALEAPEVFTGAAPEADLVIVKLKEAKQYLKDYYLLKKGGTAYQSTDIMLGVKYADTFAHPFLRPVVFCLGMGTNYGGHSGTTPLSRYLQRMGNKRSRAFVISGGEEGNRSHHFRGREKKSIGRITEGSYEEIIEIRVGEEERGFLMEIWGKIPDQYFVSIETPGGEKLPFFGSRTNKGREYSFIYEKTRITVTYALITSSQGEEVVTLRFEAPSAGIWKVILKKEGEAPTFPVHAWLPVENFLSSETYFLTPDPEITLTVPSYPENAVCVSSYSDRTNSIYVESGRGFSRGLQLKPDLAAPAVNISTAVRSLPGELRIGKQTGSILSASFTAGGTAQLLQWAYTEQRGNYLNSNEVRNLLVLGAGREDGMTYPNRQWGYGKLDLQGVFDSLANTLPTASG